MAVVESPFQEEAIVLGDIRVLQGIAFGDIMLLEVLEGMLLHWATSWSWVLAVGY